ncbi:hypothetical protein FEFB_05920 [Fructobacillus sp. EFB-N1]|nr:hypothetical protein FEFB_05920 [Fructobacillus sp. EFB-N1]
MTIEKINQEVVRAIEPLGRKEANTLYELR